NSVRGGEREMNDVCVMRDRCCRWTVRGLLCAAVLCAVSTVAHAQCSGGKGMRGGGSTGGMTGLAGGRMGGGMNSAATMMQSQQLQRVQQQMMQQQMVLMAQQQQGYQ